MLIESSLINKKVMKIRQNKTPITSDLYWWLKEKNVLKQKGLVVTHRLKAQNTWLFQTLK